MVLIWALLAALHAVESRDCTRDAEVLRAVFRGPSVGDDIPVGDDALEVSVGFEVLRLVEVAHSNAVRVDGILSRSWTDPALSFSQMMPCSSLISINRRKEELWAPEISFVNAESLTLHKHSLEIELFENGTVLHNQRLELTLPCVTDAYNYPWGLTNCTLALRSQIHPSQDLRLLWTELNHIGPKAVISFTHFARYRKAGDLALTSIGLEQSVHQKHDIQVDELWLAFHFQRTANKMLLLFYLPSILLTAIAWLSLLLGPMAITRAILVVGSLILLYLHYYVNLAGLPDTVDVTSFDVWKLFTLIFVYGTLLELVCVSCMASIGRSRRIRSCCSSSKKEKYEFEPLYEEMNDLRQQKTKFWLCLDEKSAIFRSTSRCCRFTALAIDACSFISFALIFVLFLVLFWAKGPQVLRFLSEFKCRPTMANSIRVLFPRNPPDVFDNCKAFPTFVPSVDCLFPGWALEIMMQLAQGLQLTVVPVFMDAVPGEVNWGSLENDTWAGALGYLQRNEADVISMMYQQTLVRQAYFDYSYPVTQIQEVLTVKEIDLSAEVSIWDALKPYTNDVWAIFLVSLMLQTFVFILVRVIECHMFEKAKKVEAWETVWDLFAYQLGQFQETLQFHSTSGKFLLIAFAFGHLILFLGLYESYLITALLQSSNTKPFDTLDEMITAITEKRYELLKIQNDIEASAFFDSLRKALEKNPYKMVKDSVEALDNLESGKYVMFNQIDSYATLLMNSRCGLLMIADGLGLPQKSAHFVFQRNSTFVERFNKQIIMQQSFILRTYTKYFDSGFQLSQRISCDDSAGVSTYRPLAILDCMGLFVVLLIGWAASPVALLAEQLVSRFLRRRRP